MAGLGEWWQGGERVPLVLRGEQRFVFVRRMGAGPHMTLLHGFPSSSYDWARVASELERAFSLLLCDFLGFGASEKPKQHEYSIHEQADLVEALWSREGVTSTVVVAHDYAVSVTQELLARRAEGRLDVSVSEVHLLNGGLYPDLHRPEPVQKALLDPDQGQALSDSLTGEMLGSAVAPTYFAGSEGDLDSAAMWEALSREDGHRIMYRLIRYITDRREHEQRWVDALESTDVPLAFVWGMLDPVSGAHMAERIRERLPDAPFVALEDVGHWPPLEAPERVVAAVRGAFERK